jgi:hypothetical protein
MAAQRAMSITRCAAWLFACALAPAAGAQVLAQKSQPICTLAGTDQRTLLLDGAEQWPAEAVNTDATQLFGRAVRWDKEQVLLHALAEQTSLGISLRAQRVATAVPGAKRLGPQLVLQVQRPAPGTAAAAALSRPCVWVLVQRTRAAQWRVRVLDTAVKGPQVWVALRVPA